jgi:hypothetical protein
MGFSLVPLLVPLLQHFSSMTYYVIVCAGQSGNVHRNLTSRPQLMTFLSFTSSEKLQQRLCLRAHSLFTCTDSVFHLLYVRGRSESFIVHRALLDASLPTKVKRPRVRLFQMPGLG